ncbi:MAG TPA: phosphotransferase [Candidatus Binatia bacterium]|nr:phosphotransferase [Candidatus Binatia bacterium]
MAAPLPDEALARAVRVAFGARAAIAATELLTGDASSRRYARLRLTDAVAPSAIAMVVGVEQRFGPGADEFGGPIDDRELPFVNVARWFAARGFAVPAVYHDASATDAVVLLEDLGDTSLWSAASARPADASALFGTAVDLLVAFQVAGVRTPDPACRAFRQRFDGRLARWELEHFVEHGIETRRGAPLPADTRRALLADLEPIAAPFLADDRVLVHRDFMAWNIHVQDGRLRLFDFQDALLGPDAYDLAALLTDRTTGALVTPALERSLLERFVAGRAAAGLPVAGDLAARYRACALHRALKVIGRFYFLERVLGKPGYLAYLPAVYAVARRMLDATPALAEVRARLVVWVPELAPEAA